ncbi:hypothetical protein WJX73_007098 [Symbiochloris irregularis]|uniref:Uncharacterized protein n=1 Tax=Symbiochloris irregularis TaxID=706552 RepID=A0AAW1NJG0_9CHLO
MLQTWLPCDFQLIGGRLWRCAHAHAATPVQGIFGAAASRHAGVVVMACSYGKNFASTVLNFSVQAQKSRARCSRHAVGLIVVGTQGLDAPLNPSVARKRI